MLSLHGVNHFNEVGARPVKTALFSCILYHFLSCLLQDLVSHITLLSASLDVFPSAIKHIGLPPNWGRGGRY